MLVAALLTWIFIFGSPLPKQLYIQIIWTDSSHLLDDLHNVFVEKDVLLTHLLRCKLHGVAPDKGVFELFGHVAMNAVTKVLDGSPAALENDGILVVCNNIGVYLASVPSA